MLRMTVLYPNDAGTTTFDWDYYTSSHMGLVGERFGPHMAREPEVTKGVAGLPDGAAPFICTVAMYFADQAALQAAMAAGGADVPKDIPNFTNAQPVMQIDELV